MTSQSPFASLRRRFCADDGGVCADERGVSAVEFALLTPVFGVLLAGTLDIGGELHTRFGLNAAVAAGSNYAVVKAADVTSANAATLADSIAKIVSSSQSTNYANVTVVINNGPSAQTEGTQTSKGGTASQADSCYCPVTTVTGLSWGASVSCGSACSGGGLAGKFITIKATRSYTPFINGFGVSNGGTITASAMVQTQ